MSARSLCCSGPVYQLTPVRDGAVVDGEQVIGCLVCNQTPADGPSVTEETGPVAASSGGSGLVQRVAGGVDPSGAPATLAEQPSGGAS